MGNDKKGNHVRTKCVQTLNVEDYDYASLLRHVAITFRKILKAMQIQ